MNSNNELAWKTHVCLIFNNLRHCVLNTGQKRVSESVGKFHPFLRIDYHSSKNCGSNAPAERCVCEMKIGRMREPSSNQLPNQSRKDEDNFWKGIYWSEKEKIIRDTKGSILCIIIYNNLNVVQMSCKNGKNENTVKRWWTTSSLYPIWVSCPLSLFLEIE